MTDAKTRILIVDDEPTIRTSMSLVLTGTGYRVRCAQDGFTALAELRKEVPDILLSDLNMPGMSGFELLSVVRRRFPSMQTVAMSGAFQGDEVPSGVAADAFYQKGSTMGSLMRVLGSLHRTDAVGQNFHSTAAAPIWIQPNGHENCGEPYVTIVCPDCLRTFPQALGGCSRVIREAECVYCRNLIRFAVVQQAERPLGEVLQGELVDQMRQQASEAGDWRGVLSFVQGRSS